MSKLACVFFVIFFPLFVIGGAFNAMWNAMIAGWYWVDSKYHPQLYKLGGKR